MPRKNGFPSPPPPRKVFVSHLFGELLQVKKGFRVLGRVTSINYSHRPSQNKHKVVSA